MNKNLNFFNTLTNKKEKFLPINKNKMLSNNDIHKENIYELRFITELK